MRYNTSAITILEKDVNIVLQQRQLPLEIEKQLEVVQALPAFRKEVFAESFTNRTDWMFTSLEIGIDYPVVAGDCGCCRGQ